MRLIPVDEVCYFQAEDKYTKVVTPPATRLIRKTIKELFDELDPDVFWQVHREHHRQPARDRPRRARLSRPAAHRPQGQARAAHGQPYLRASVQDHVDARPPSPGAYATAARASLRARVKWRFCLAIPTRRFPWTHCSRRSMPPGNGAPSLPRPAHPHDLRDAVASVIAELDAGRLRVAEKRGTEWVTHQWLKKAVLLSFRLADNVADRPGGAQRAVSLLRQGADQVRPVRRRRLRARPACASCRRR